MDESIRNPEDRTTIQISWRLLNFLKDIGKKNESYEDIIVRNAKAAGYTKEAKAHGFSQS